MTVQNKKHWLLKFLAVLVGAVSMLFVGKQVAAKVKKVKKNSKVKKSKKGIK
jgi:hypothetical protein